MAANKKAIKLLFGVEGGGSISSGSGKLINDDIKKIVQEIEKNTAKIKFSIDTKAFKAEIDKIKTEINALKQQIQGMPSLPTGGKYFGSQADEYANAVKTVRDYYALIDKVNRANTRGAGIGRKDANNPWTTNVGTYKELAKQMQTAQEGFDKLAVSGKAYEQEITDLQTRLETKTSLNRETYQAAAEKAWGNLSAKVSDYVDRVENAAKRDTTAAMKLKALRQLSDTGNYQDYDRLNKMLLDTRRYINANELATEKWYQKFAKTFGSRVRSLLAGLIGGALSNYIRKLFSSFVNIDTSIGQLKIVTKATHETMSEFLTNSIALSKELGASVKDVLGSIETFSRLGYDINESTVLAKYSSIMSKVAKVTSEQATTGVTSIIKGYGFDPEDAEHISDVLVSVGQKYAISASELMTAYEKSGAALNAAGTSFEKSAAIYAAGNASIQNADVLGTALKTLSARIRNSKTELAELGETVDDLSDGFSKYAKEIKSLSGVDIMVEGSTNQFKDLYEIFNSLSSVWNKLSDAQQARISEILGGTRQFQVVSSIIQNWGDAVGAYETAIGSSGESSKALATYLDTVQGRLGQLQASFEELSSVVMGSSFVKTTVNFLSKIVNLLSRSSSLLGGLSPTLVLIFSLFAHKSSFAGWVTAELEKVNVAVRTFGGEISTSLIYNKQFEEGLEADIKLLGELSAALQNSDGSVEALENALKGLSGQLSSGAMGFVYRNREALKNNPDAAIGAYQRESRVDEFSVMAAAARPGSLQAKNLINIYNKEIVGNATGQIDSLKMSVDDFYSALEEGNPKLSVYIKGLNGAEGSMRGFKKSANEAKTSSLALSVAITMIASTVLSKFSEAAQKGSNSAKLAFGIIATAAGIATAAMMIFGETTKAFMSTNPIGWVMLAISAITMGIQALFSLKSAEEQLEELNDAIEEHIAKVKDLANSYKELQKKGTDNFDRFAELAKGVNEFGDNISLTDEEYEEFLRLNNEIAEMFPDLVSGYDSQGNAMLSLSYTADNLTDTLWALVEAERAAANGEISKGFEDTLENIREAINIVEGDFSKTERLSSGLNEWANSYNKAVGYGHNGNVDYRERPVLTAEEMRAGGWTDVNNDDYFTTYDSTHQIGDSGYTALVTPILPNGEVLSEDELNHYVDDVLNGSTREEILASDTERLIIHLAKVTGEEADEYFDKLEDKLAVYKEHHIQFWRELNEETEGIETEKLAAAHQKEIDAYWNKLRPTVSAWAQTEGSFDAIGNDFGQKLALNMIGNIDFSQMVFGNDEKANAEQIKEYVKYNILEPLLSMGPEVEEVFANITDWGTMMQNGEMTYVEFGEKVREAFVKGIENVPEESKPVFLSLFEKVFDGDTFEDALDNLIESYKPRAQAAKSVFDIVEKIQDSWDAMSDAIKDMDDYGYLSVKTLLNLKKELPEVEKYLTTNAGAYSLTSEAMEKYVAHMIDVYAAESMLVNLSQEGKDNIINNLENLKAALAALAVSSGKVKSNSEKRKDALNDEKDALKKQLDAYKELIDLRKKLLKQYQEEVEYKKELEKKQKKLAKLQTQYTVSQLDTSASGRSKTRELAKELAEAEEDLEDFTLEHAIDQITNELDAQYEEYKNFIDGKLDNIEDTIKNLSDSNSGSASALASAIQSAISAVEQRIQEVNDRPITVDVKVSLPDYNPGNMSDRIQRLSNTGISVMSYRDYSSRKGYTEKFGEGLEGYNAYINAMYGARFDYATHHSGGIVGELAKLKSTEEFAKLLKGEFVSTPAQMERFMKQTLPDMVSIGNGGVEINSPLVTIQCDNVTQDALPKLKQIVDSAVERIKDELDSGMSRAGYKKTAKKITI